MTPDPVTFELADDGSASDPSPQPAREDASSPGSRKTAAGPVREAERDRYPLAGPILDEARARVLRGRCSSCEARLRLRLQDGLRGPVTVRCPICGRTGEIEA